MILNNAKVINDIGLLDVLTIIVPTLTSIIGFIATYIITKKQITKEFENEKKRTVLNNAKEILSYCAKMIDFKWYGSENCFAEMQEMMNIVIAYGSKDAIKILSAFQQYTYTRNFISKKPTQEESIELLTLPCLLLTQVKYDITGEIVSPDYYLKIRLTDYETKEGLKEKFKKYTNKQINSLNLNKKFKI